MKRAIFLLWVFFLPVIVVAQIDNEFWFAAPDVTSGHFYPATLGDGRPISFYITAEQATNVRIEMPANPAFTPITFSLAASEYRQVSLAPPFSPAEFENYPNVYPSGVQKKGIKITSDPGNITVYYELNNPYNRDIFSLKGKNALGSDFYVSTQNFFRNGNYTPLPYSGFVIVATEDNTIVHIGRNSTWQHYTSPPPEDITITLNKGETFAFVSNNQAAAGHINGVHVYTDGGKKIAITWYDDSIRKRNNATNYSYDICGDQTIPVNLIGTRYIVMKGSIYMGDDGGERYFITATHNNTQIFLNGSATPVATINTGQVYSGQVTTTSLLIETSFPVYVNHISGTGNGGELGGATLPTIDGCTGSHRVTFTRNTITSDLLQLNLMVRNETNPSNALYNKSVDNFYLIVGSNSYKLSKNYFSFLADSSWAFLKWYDPDVQNFFNSPAPGKIPPGTTATIYNPIALFHLGVQNGGPSNGGKYGYFSDYSSKKGLAGIGGPRAPVKKTYCNLDPIMFAVEGGLAYKWEGTDFPGDTIYLSSTTGDQVIFNPPGPTTPSHPYKFKVTISRDCFGDTTIFLAPKVFLTPVANFDISDPVGCSPHQPIFTNRTDFGLAETMLWDFNYEHKNSDTSSQALLSNPFIHHFPENVTDTPQYYRVKLFAWAAFGECLSEREKVVTVLPNVIAGFIADTNKGCNPLTVAFTDTTRGYLDVVNSYWDFDTYQQTYLANPSRTFVNGSNVDKTHNVRLIAFSTSGCTDTAVYPVTVHPFIKANFGLDNLVDCSPFLSHVNATGSIGVSNFHWNIFDSRRSYMDSSFIRNEKSIFDFVHNDTSQPNPDTLFISLYGENSFGCTDTAITKRMVIYPEVHAIFTTSEDEVCDSTNILFANYSMGYKLRNEWNLGDGAYLIDTTGNGFNHKYFNRTGNKKEYEVELLTTSDYFCSDTAFDTITVYPFVKANFAIDYSNNCSPLNVKVMNTSKGGANFNWNFGDGNTLGTTDTATLYHIYDNQTDNDTTYYINLKAVNSYGCADSLERSVFLFPQVVADFAFDGPNEGCNPLNVDFINNSRGRNLDYIWDFGDKTYSTSQNPPPRVYKNSTPKDTTYYVNLTVMNLAGCDSNITKTVKVYSKVTADFAVERVDSCSPFRIQVDNFSSGGITDFIWKYTTSDSITLHSFTDPVIPVYHNTGIAPIKHPLVLRTRNAHGCSAVKSDTITVFPEMHTVFHPDKVQGCQPLTVGLVNNSNLKSGTTFLWNFGDGLYSNLASPVNHLFKNLTGNSVKHDILLEATSQYGCFDDTLIAVNVFPYIYAKFSLDKPAICSDEPFSIDRNSTAGAINHYYWNYDDGTGSHEKADATYNFTYHNPGINDKNPKITLTVTNAQGCDTSWTETIAVHPEVRAAFAMDHTEICYPASTGFINQSTPAIPLTWNWEFGDGSSSASKSPVHDYKNFSRTADKSFTVNLTATSEFGCDSTISHTVTIHPKPLAGFSFPVAVDCPPFVVPFSNESQGTALSYKWDFGNGQTCTETNPQQVYNNTGSDIEANNVVLIAETIYGCSDTITKPVQVYPEVQVDFDASEWNGCSPLQISFNGTATNENEFNWYIENNVFSNYEDPSYRFKNESTSDKIYNIRFHAVSINGCEDDTVKQVTVFPMPLAEFLPDPQALDYDTGDDITEVTMNNQTNNQSLWNYHWNYGDGSTSTENAASFIKKYTIWGDINNENRIPVTLSATSNNHPECADTIMHYVIIKPPLPKVEIGPDVSGCMPLSVDFSAYTKYVHSNSFHWDFGYKDLESTSPNPQPVVFDTAGMYIVRLSVEGDGGPNWDYKTIQVYPKPVINFDFDPKYAWLKSQTEPGTPIKFFNNTYHALNFEWDFGDETTSSENQPQHEYMKAGEYYVRLRAENEYTCWDTLTSPVPVIIEGHGLLEFPSAITIIPDSPADEYYDPDDKSNRRIFRPLNEGVRRYKLEIYNRWGELIFSTDEISRGWNGFIKGKPAKQDVYVWRVTATFTNGQPYVDAGDVTVLVQQP